MRIESKADLPLEADLDLVYWDLMALASDQYAPASKLAVKGMEAYWHSFRCRYPDMLTPGQTMLRRVEQEGLEAVGDGDLYYNARATAAFHEVYADWASNETADPESLGHAHVDLLPVLEELNREPPDTVTGSYLRRIGFMAFVARGGDPLVMFPPPPILHRRAGQTVRVMPDDIEHMAEMPHKSEEVDAFFSVDGALVGARLPKRAHAQTQPPPPLSISADKIYWNEVQRMRHPFMEEVEGLARNPLYNEIVRLTTGLLVREPRGVTSPDKGLLDAITEEAIGRTRESVDRYHLMPPPGPAPST